MMERRNSKRDELNKYSALSEVMLNLKKHGYIDQFQKILLNIYHDERKYDYLYTEKLKEGIRVIVDGLLEEIWRENTPTSTYISTPSTPVFEPSKSPLQLKVPGNLSGKNSATPELSQHSITSHKRSVNSLLVRSESELASFSEFNTVVGPSTFGKAKREFNIEIRNNSPGPAAYKADPFTVKNKIPQVFIPKSGKRFEFITHPDMPGPNQYYPSKRFISKR